MKKIKYPNLKFKVEYHIDENGNIYSPNTDWNKMFQRTDENGYKNIYLYLKDGTRKYFKVHRLILNTFKPIENSENFQVNHINGIKNDNRLENLEWCTRSENLLHAFDTGLEDKPIGEKNPNHKLSEKEVIEICKMIKNKTPISIIASNYGVTKGTISHIKNKRTWKGITTNFDFN